MENQKTFIREIVNSNRGPFLRVLVFTLTCAMIFMGSPTLQTFAAPPDFEEIRRQAEQGSPENQFHLGYMYLHGIGVTKNPQVAKKWYTHAAEQGHRDAQNNLGVMYFKGQGIPRDYQQAMHWYKKAAENGLDNAAASVGGMYLKGDGVEANGWIAIEWYGLAARRGNWRAQHDIALIFRRGLAGVPVDLVRAYAWYMVAAIRGGTKIESLVDELATEMTHEQIAEGEKLSEAIWSKVDAPITYPVDAWEILLFGPDWVENRR